jgi:hypothetical protein
MNGGVGKEVERGGEDGRCNNRGVNIGTVDD